MWREFAKTVRGNTIPEAGLYYHNLEWDERGFGGFRRELYGEGCLEEAVVFI